MVSGSKNDGLIGTGRTKSRRGNGRRSSGITRSGGSRMSSSGSGQPLRQLLRSERYRLLDRNPSGDLGSHLH